MIRVIYEDLASVTAYLGDTALELIPPLWFLVSCCILVLAVKILHIFSAPEAPFLTFSLTHKDNFVIEVLKKCPILLKSYTPPILWGRNGHIQTATYGLLGHASLKRVADKRECLKFSDDGTTVTFDLFEPLVPHSDGDLTLCLCPGIANHSESNYIRTCVHYAQEAGYRCAVLNHLGALSDVPLTSPKLFTYGGTREYGSMVERVCQLYPDTKIMIIGFSMGGNIVTKYLGHLDHPNRVLSRIIMGISVCQGYDATKICRDLQDYAGGRRFYMYVMAENFKRLLRKHYEQAVKPHVKSGLVDERQIWASTSLLTIDEAYNTPVHGFESIEEYYKDSSCLHLIEKVRVPMIYINAADDPLFTPSLWQPVRDIAARSKDIMFVLVKHGGHLGFLEGSSFHPHSITWLDRLIVDVCNAASTVQVHTQTTNSHDHNMF